MSDRLPLHPSAFPNIIFDLGGVILNIDYHRTIRAFEELGMHGFSETYTQLHQNELFDAFERGEIAPQTFRDAIRTGLGPEVTDAGIDAAWNAMLLDLPAQRLVLLKEIAMHKRTFLLSNTNRIHVDSFEAAIAAEHGMDSLSPLFEQTYYSCDVGMRKPEERIFRMVVDAHGLDPAQTLFIDDSPQHIEGARRAGLHAYHLTGGQTIIDLFGQVPG